MLYKFPYKKIYFVFITEGSDPAYSSNCVEMGYGFWIQLVTDGSWYLTIQPTGGRCTNEVFKNRNRVYSSLHSGGGIDFDPDHILYGAEHNGRVAMGDWSNRQGKSWLFQS